MKKNLTELVFILDKSGSMAGLERDTIGGFNAMLEKQKRSWTANAGLQRCCLITAMSCCTIEPTSGPLRPITAKEYHVGGSTALLDAVGQNDS